LDSDVTLQFRRAQDVDAHFADGVRKVCERCRQIAACYLLDARRPDTGEMAVIIAVTVDNEAENMGTVAQQFQAMLRQAPAPLPSTFIMSSSSFIESYGGAEFYSRQAV
jgi:hypothetical protein